MSSSQEYDDKRPYEKKPERGAPQHSEPREKKWRHDKYYEDRDDYYEPRREDSRRGHPAKGPGPKNFDSDRDDRDYRFRGPAGGPDRYHGYPGKQFAEGPPPNFRRGPHPRDVRYAGPPHSFRGGPGPFGPGGRPDRRGFFEGGGFQDRPGYYAGNRPFRMDRIRNEALEKDDHPMPPRNTREVRDGRNKPVGVDKR